jgi:hypothetical protein
MVAWAKFKGHKVNASQRGILFLLTFPEWWEIWQASGHWHERGKGRGQYVMARKGPDIGPYAVGNVEIILASENVAQSTNKSPGRPTGSTDPSSIESKKPWLAAGVTRRTWFRRRETAAQRLSRLAKQYEYNDKNLETIRAKAREKYHAEAAQRRRAASEIGRAG